MEDAKMLFDASAYMLFEATGDSDAAFEIDSAAAEDDAQSCSSGSACGGGAWFNDSVDAGGDDFRGADFDAWSDDDDDGDGGGGAASDDDDDGDGVVDQCRSRAAAPVKSNGCEDSNAKMMNERERDRQFWEACLAS